MFGYAEVRLNEVAKYSNDRISYKELNKNNYVGVDNLLQNKKGKTLSTYVPAEGNFTKFMKNDILIGNIRPYLRKIWLSDSSGGTNGDVLDIRIKVKNIILPKYLYYILSSDKFFEYNTQNSRGAKMPRGDKHMVMNYKFVIPTINEQQKIVNILDRFDWLVNNLSDGLPAEIKLRQQQYEYYRDKLLMFTVKDD